MGVFFGRTLIIAKRGVTLILPHIDLVKNLCQFIKASLRRINSVVGRVINPKDSIGEPPTPYVEELRGIDPFSLPEIKSENHGIALDVLPTTKTEKRKGAAKKRSRGSQRAKRR